VSLWRLRASAATSSIRGVLGGANPPGEPHTGRGLAGPSFAKASARQAPRPTSSLVIKYTLTANQRFIPQTIDKTAFYSRGVTSFCSFQFAFKMLFWILPSKENIMKTPSLARLGAVLISFVSLPFAGFAISPTLYFKTGFNPPAAADSRTLMKHNGSSRDEVLVSGWNLPPQLHGVLAPSPCPDFCQ